MDKEYTEPTAFCDCGDSGVRRKSLSLSSGCAGPVGAAVAVFDFVREEIPYRFDYPARHASETLAAKRGNCFNKANLQVALMRAMGVCAGYEVMLVTREIFRPLLPARIFEMVREPTVHVCAACCRDGKWITADATIDGEIFSAFYRGRNGWKHESWDGLSRERIPAEFVLEHQGVYAGVDLFLQTPPRFWNDDLLQEANAYLEKNLNERRRK